MYFESETRIVYEYRMVESQLVACPLYLVVDWEQAYCPSALGNVPGNRNACPGKGLTLKILLWFLLNAYRFLIIVKWKNLKSNNFKWGPSVEVYLLCVHSG